MGFYIGVFLVHWKQSLSKMLIYRTSALISVIYAAVYLAGSFLAVQVFFSHSNTLGGWNEGEMLVLMGAFQLMATLFDVLFLWAQDSIPEDIMEGNLDIHLLRPANSLVLISTRELYIPGIVNLPIPLLMIFYGLHIAGLNPSGLEWTFFIAAVLAGTLLMFCLTQIVLNLCFWIEGYSGIWALSDELIKFGSRPLRMYAGPIRLALGYLLPVITALNLPADILTSQVNLQGVVITLTALAALVVLMLVQWNRGLRRYQSASS